jgi:hypothetical protein
VILLVLLPTYEPAPPNEHLILTLDTRPGGWRLQQADRGPRIVWVAGAQPVAIPLVD